MILEEEEEEEEKRRQRCLGAYPKSESRKRRREEGGEGGLCRPFNADSRGWDGRDAAVFVVVCDALTQWRQGAQLTAFLLGGRGGTGE